ncbi:hypothetical protein XU18_0432 [Perkinsela sp. CCAP 1560/4]|nr:hypothetical protein XU18_0432 [Perkinsela sp. CCAP 1560/4]|eukprot:KNH09747.1 hypothetical protein XU18_0432 [Perkinsela sp. CCAP 1560/4]
MQFFCVFLSKQVRYDPSFTFRKMKCPLPQVEKQNRVPLWVHTALCNISGREANKNYVPITKIDIFDFDGTLFYSPSPNISLWRDIEDALNVGIERTDLKKNHKLLVEKVMDGGLGWYQSVETLLPPLVTSLPVDRPVSQSEVTHSKENSHSKTHITMQHQNYFTGDREDKWYTDTKDADFIFSNRMTMALDKNERDDSLSENLFCQSNPLFNTSELSNHINPRVLDELRQSSENPSHLTIVLTGRNILFTRVVEEVLQSANVKVDDIKMKPLVIPLDSTSMACGKTQEDSIASILKHGAFNPITTLGMKEEYLTSIITYYTSPISAVKLQPGIDSNSVRDMCVPHIRIFEDRRGHIAKFQELLQSLLNRPLRIFSGNLKTQADRTVSIKDESFLVESSEMVQHIFQCKKEREIRSVGGECIQPFIETTLHRDFTHEVIHVNERTESLPTQMEFAIVAHLQSVYHNVLFDLCPNCCCPIAVKTKAKSVGNADVKEGAVLRDMFCQCGDGNTQRNNPYYEQIKASRDAYLSVLK